MLAASMTNETTETRAKPGHDGAGQAKSVDGSCLQTMDNPETNPPASANPLMSLLNPEALRQIVVEACRRGDVKVNLPADVIKRLLGDQSKAAAAIIAEQVGEMAVGVAKQIARNVRVKVQDREPVLLDNPHKQVLEMIALFEALPPHLRNIMVAGPAGSGKTTAAKHIAAGLGIKPEHVFVQNMIVTKYDSEGFVDAGGKYHTTMFRKFAESPEGFILQDEFDSSPDASAHLPLNTYTANGYYDFPDGFHAVRSPRHFIMAAGNTWGTGATMRYVGRCKLDGATKDRYQELPWEIDEELESRLVAHAGPEWHPIVLKYRKAVDKLNLDHMISPRDAMRAAAFIHALKWSHETAITRCFKRSLRDADWQKIVANLQA